MQPIKFKEVLIEISQNCNLSCIMCGFGKENNSNQKFMTFDNFAKIFEKLKNNTQSIRLNGRGESTIHRDFIPIFNYVFNANIPIQLFSNLNFNDENIIECFIKSNPQLYISMDSPNKKKLENIRRGAKFDRIITNLKNLKSLAKRPFVVFTIQETNWKEIENIADFAITYKCHIIYNVVRRDNDMKEFRNLISKNKDFICKAFDNVKNKFDDNFKVLIPNQISGIKLYDYDLSCGTKIQCPNIQNELCVQYDGTVTPCNMFNPYRLGNIFNQTLEEILYGKRMIYFKNHYKKMPYCKNCACLKEEQ